MRAEVIIDNAFCLRALGAQPVPGAVRKEPTPAGRHEDAAAACRPVRNLAALVATLLFFVLLAHCLDLRAALLYRSAQPTNGEQRWSDWRKYDAATHPASLHALADAAMAVPEEVQVVVSGFISAEDVTSAKVMEDLLRSGKQKIAGNLVSFASSGGDFDAALELGRMLHKLGVSTIVGRDDQCLSSCVFAFMGGDRRIAAGRIGIHRPYFSSTRYVLDRRSLYRQLQKKLREYIEEFDFPPSLYEEVMAVSSETMRVLSPADLKRFYLDGMSPSVAEEADAESARRLGIPILEFLQRKARACTDPQAQTCTNAMADAPQRQRLDSGDGRTESALGLGPSDSRNDSTLDRMNSGAP